MKRPSPIVVTIIAAGLLGGSVMAVAAQSPTDEPWPIPPSAPAAASDTGSTVPDDDRTTTRVLVTYVTDALTHPCPLTGGDSRVPMADDPSAFIEDLQAISGLRLVELEETTLDGWPAIAATAVAMRCGTADLHLTPGLGPWVPLHVPSRLLVADVGGSTVMVQVWGGTRSDLDEQIGAVDLPGPASVASPGNPAEVGSAQQRPRTASASPSSPAIAMARST